MKKYLVVLGFVLCVVAAGLVQSRPAGAAEDAVFLKDGNMIVGEITDISSNRMVVQFKDGSEIPLMNVAMINCVDRGKDFPDEAEQITTNQHYVFLKNGEVRMGKIVDYSSEQRVFEFATGEKFPHDMIKRVYFVKMEGGPIIDPALSGVQAWIFLKNESQIAGEIIDISSQRHTLQLKDQPEIPLKDLFMINFEGPIKEYPAETNQLNENKDYAFLKDGRVKLGILIDFSSELKVFQFDTGANFAPNMMKRIYLHYAR
jgi:hypothetical protein